MSSLTGSRGSPCARAPQRASLGRNVVALYVLQIANYVIPLVTLPYLMRTLGAGQYGVMAIAYAVVFFLVLFVDAGFNTRATRELARGGIDHARVNEIYAATQWIKLAQSLIALLVLLLLVATVPTLRANAAVYLASFLIVVGSLMFPTWLFQGLEIMHCTTLCSVAGRLLAMAGIFLLVREPADVVIAAALQASATAISGALSTTIVFGRLRLTMFIPRRQLVAAVRRTVGDARGLAVSEYLTNAMANSGVFVLSLFVSDAAVGVYAALEKVARAAFSAFQPLLKALFPRISARWLGAGPDAAAYSRVWETRIVALVLLAAMALYICAPLTLHTLFGRDWVAHADLMRILAAWLFFAVTASVIGQLGLLARGHQAHYAACLATAGGVQLCAGLVGAALFGAFGVAASMVLVEATRLALFSRALRKRNASVTA